MNFLELLAAPNRGSGDTRSRQYVLNIVLLSTLLLCFVALVVNQIDLVRSGAEYRGVPAYVIPDIFLGFLALYLLAKRGFVKVASFGLLALYFTGATYTLATWGADLPIGLMVYALVITLSGVLLGRRMLAAISGIVIFTFAGLWRLQVSGRLSPETYWKVETMETGDVFVLAFILVVVASVSYLYESEIMRSLLKARDSEDALKRERDHLEEEVLKRTEQLKRSQLEKLLQFHSFADMGKLASGLFHDLINPLTVVALSLKKADERTSEISSEDVKAVRDALHRAQLGTEHMQRFVVAARKQVRHEQNATLFSACEEIEQILEFLSHKAADASVQLRIKCPEPFSILSDPVKFVHVATNLVANAIEAYHPKHPKEKDDRFVLIHLKKRRHMLHMKVQDWGRGLSKTDAAKIFEPFYTASDAKESMGIGLTITKDIVENELGGSISVRSSPGGPTEFLVEIPVEASSHHPPHAPSS